MPVGTYGYAGWTDAGYTEDSPAVDDFWGRDSLLWEAAALEAERHGVRPVVLRTGYVLSAQPGSRLVQQVEQFRRGFGGPVLPGSQWVPWVRIADVAGLILLAMEDARVRGSLNVVAPGVVRNREFAATLARVVGRSARLPIPGFMLRLGFGITADTMVHGRRVVPRRARPLILATSSSSRTSSSGRRCPAGTPAHVRACSDEHGSRPWQSSPRWW